MLFVFNVLLSRLSDIMFLLEASNNTGVGKKVKKSKKDNNSRNAKQGKGSSNKSPSTSNNGNHDAKQKKALSSGES